MDGDIKRHEPNPKTRAKQKSATLARKAVAPKHKQSTPLGKVARSTGKHGTKKPNPFAPPENLRTGLRIRHMLSFGVLALLLFGASMFLLGVSFGGDEVVTPSEKKLTRDGGDVPQCTVIWDSTSPVTSPTFTLQFDRELPAGFRPQFIANQQIIRPTDGVYTLDATTPSEYEVIVMQESDVVTKDILCEYGPVLVGLDATTSAAP